MLFVLNQYLSGLLFSWVDSSELPFFQILFSICFSEISRWVVFVQLSFGIFQGCIVVHFSRFILFFAVVLSSNSVILSQVFRFVNNFFKLFSTYFLVDVVLHFCATTKLSISSKIHPVNSFFEIFLTFSTIYFFQQKSP